jgi:ATP-dependent Lon protease
MSRRLPLFPLEVVLFPGALLPLHIFEPRYRDLLTDCLAGDRRFGLVPAGSGEHPPAPGAVGTTALVRATQPLPDGRSNILVAGEARFLVRRYLEEPKAYLVGWVEPFADEEQGTETPADVRDDLVRLADRCLAALSELTDQAEQPAWSADPGELTFQIAARLRLDRDFQRRFLGMRSPAHRAVLLHQLLPKAAAELEGRAATRTRARRNGSGGSAPDLEFPG